MLVMHSPRPRDGPARGQIGFRGFGVAAALLRGRQWRGLGRRVAGLKPCLVGQPVVVHWIGGDEGAVERRGGSCRRGFLQTACV